MLAAPLDENDGILGEQTVPAKGMMHSQSSVQILADSSGGKFIHHWQGPFHMGGSMRKPVAAHKESIGNVHHTIAHHQALPCLASCRIEGGGCSS